MKAFLLSFLSCGDHSGWKPCSSIWGLRFHGESNPGLLSDSSSFWTFPSNPSKENRQKSDFSNCFIPFCTKNFTKKFEEPDADTKRRKPHDWNSEKEKCSERENKSKHSPSLFQFQRRRSFPSGAGGLKPSVTFFRANAHIDL